MTLEEAKQIVVKKEMCHFKYVRLGCGQVIFGHLWENHKALAKNKEVFSAGFVGVYSGDYVGVYGESTTLRIGPDVSDKELLSRMFEIPVPGF